MYRKPRFSVTRPALGSPILRTASSMVFLALVMILATSGSLGTPVRAQASPEEPPVPESVTASGQGTTETGIRESEDRLRLERALTGIWWNRPRMIRALALDAEQRAAMDVVLRDSLPERRELQGRLRDAQRAFGRAAVAGERLAAGQALGELAEHTAGLQRFEGQLKLQVLGHMRAEQREQLAENFPALLQRPWIVTRAVRRGFRRSRGAGEP